MSAVNIIQWPGLLDSSQCRALIDAARPHVQPSTVSGVTRIVHPGRTSHDAEMTDDAVHAALGRAGARRLEDALGAISGQLPTHREPFKLIRYQPGQQYRPHWDYFVPTADYAPKLLSMGGQRTISAIVYLCTVQKGGTTDFPRLSTRIYADEGSMIAWNNIDREGNVLVDSFHGGMPPTGDEDKWILTAWYRQNVYTGPRPEHRSSAPIAV